MAATVVNLAPFNTVTLAASTVYHLTAPGQARYNLYLLNSGTGPIYLKGDATVAAGDAASFELPVNLGVTVVIYGTSAYGIFVSGGAAAGLVSALLLSRSE